MPHLGVARPQGLVVDRWTARETSRGWSPDQSIKTANFQLSSPDRDNKNVGETNVKTTKIPVTTKLLTDYV